MKKISVLAVMAVLAVGIAFTSCDSRKSMGSVKLNSEIDSISYIIGRANAYGMVKQAQMQVDSWPMKGNSEAFIAGVHDAINNPDDSLFLGRDMAGLNDYLNSFFMNAQQIVAENNRADGERFMNENKTKSGVITTESGLQYKVITEGTGAKPKPEDVVKVHYVLKLIDGTLIESSVQNGEPIDIPLGNVIAGWREGIQLMPVGSKYMLWIPSDMAYGEDVNQGSPILPNSALEFEVELFEIVK